MDSRYSERRDNYRLPEEGIRIDLRAERARRRSRSSYGRAGAVAKQQPNRPRRRSNQVTARHRKPSDSLSLIHISEPTRREWLSRMPSSA